MIMCVHGYKVHTNKIRLMCCRATVSQFKVYFFSCNEDSVDNLSEDGDLAADLPSEDG